MGGPHASFTFALALVALCFVTAPPAVIDMLFALACFNVLLGSMNLLPAPPLDGYRLLVGASLPLS